MLDFQAVYIFIHIYFEITKTVFVKKKQYSILFLYDAINKIIYKLIIDNLQIDIR